MSATAAAHPQGSTRTRIVTTETVSGAGDKPKSFKFPEEFEEFVRTCPAGEQSQWTIYVYRLASRESRDAQGSYIDKLFVRADFDEEYLRTKAGPDGQGFGGGFYRIVLKAPSGEWKSQGVYEVAGPPRTPIISAQSNPQSQTPGVAVDPNNALGIEALRLSSNPEVFRAMMEIMTRASINAMDMLKAQMPVQQSPLEMLKAAKDLFGPSVAPAPDGGGVLALLLPIIPELLKRALTPGDPLENVKMVTSLAEALKNIGGGNVKPDLASTFVAALPAIGEKLTNGIREYRLASESQERSIMLSRGINPNDPKTITMPPPVADAGSTTQPPADASAPVAPAQPPAVPAPPGSMAWFLLRIAKGIEDPGSTADDLFDFVMQCRDFYEEPGNKAWFDAVTSDKQTVATTLQNSYNQIFGEGNPHLAKVLANPRLEKLIDDYCALCAADRAAIQKATAPPPAGKPN